jgi:uncharacterized protein involved in exopolysaccharide biosynthesis
LQGLSLGRGGYGPRLPELLRSRSLVTELLRTTVEYEGQRVQAFQMYERGASDSARDFAEVLRKVRRHRLDASYDPRTDVVRLTLLAPDRELAAKLANDLASRLNERLVHDATEHARGQKAFIEERLQEVRGDLERAEVALRDFREANRAIQDSPALRLQEGRLLRDVHQNEQVHATLATQYELARIEEVKNLPVIDVLDEATPPQRRARPRRAFRFAAGLALVMVLLAVMDAASYLRTATEAEV